MNLVPTASASARAAGTAAGAVASSIVIAKHYRVMRWGGAVSSHWPPLTGPARSDPTLGWGGAPGRRRFARALVGNCSNCTEAAHINMRNE